MTKAQIRALAEDVNMMDTLNSISGLLEMNKPTDKELIESMINYLYKQLNKVEHPTYKPTKAQMLHYIINHDEELYNKLKNKRYLEIRLDYIDLTKNNNQ